MMVLSSAEHRPLKRQRLGPPDVYPQDAKQREDELDDDSVKHGFKHKPDIENEYASALNYTFNSAKVAESFNGILKKKAELNQLPDTGRKKQQINAKDHFWLVTLRTKSNIEAWFKDLAGSKPLANLLASKKVPSVPIFPKKEDMLFFLCKYTVPFQRAIWFIKMTSFYHESKNAESKIKKRQQPDQSQEMTQMLTRFLKEQFLKICELYGVSTGSAPLSTTSGGSTPGHNSVAPNSTPPSSTSFTGPATPSSLPQPPHASPHHGIGGSSSPPSSAQLSDVMRNWNYAIQLTLVMYQEGLLDRQDLLEWVVDNMTRHRSCESESLLRVLLPLGLQYLDEITQSEFLSRKLAYFSATKLHHMCVEAGYTGPVDGASVAASSVRTGAPSNPQFGQAVTDIPGVNGSGPPLDAALANVFLYLLSSHQHRSIVLTLAAFLQAITLDCSTALVWNHGGEKRNWWLCGSPLDHLPCPPSQLPMPMRHNNNQIREELRNMEEHLQQRSRAAENRWSLDKYGVDITGWTTNRVLAALDALDRHYFDRVENNNSLDTLYAKIFAFSKEITQEGAGAGGAVTTNVGNSSLSANSAITVASNSSSSSVSGSSWSSSSGCGSAMNGSLVGGTWPECGDEWEDAVVTTVCEWAVTAQRCGEHRAVVAARLLERRQSWLISDAQRSGGSSVPYYSFQKLLFKFLDTQAPVFDECRGSERSREFGNLVLLFSELIRHDVFSHDTYMCTLISRGDLTDPPAPLSPLPTHHGVTQDIKEEQLDPMDEDLDKMLLTMSKETAGEGSSGHYCSPAHQQHDFTSCDDSTRGATLSCETESKTRPLQQPRHLVYAQHFPLPSDDTYTHETNQRYVLLYGVGKARDEARHVVKKLSKEISKLFSKKFSIDIAEGGKVKKSCKNEFSFEHLQNRFSSLSYFDQHLVSNIVSQQVVEMVCSCASGSSSYLPLLDHVAFFMDLMEAGLNIHGLLQLCCQLIKEVVDIQSVLSDRLSHSINYCPQLTLLVLGVLRKYNKCLLVSQDQTCLVFEGLLRLVKHVSNPAECSSAERIVLSYLHTLYTSCSFIKLKHQDTFASTSVRIRQALNFSHPPSDGKFRRNPHVLEEYINNPKLRVEVLTVKQQLSEPSNRYSFACSAVLAAVNASSNTRLNDIAVLCAEATACCNALSSEWLGILKVLCSSVSGSSTPSSGGHMPYSDILAAIDLRDPATASAAHASLSVLTAVLIARDCFTFEDLIIRVVVYSLKAAWNDGLGNPEVEPGARLACYLLLRIFQSVDTAQPAQYSPGSPSANNTSSSVTALSAAVTASAGGGAVVAGGTALSGAANSASGGAAVNGQKQRSAAKSVRLSCDRHLLIAARLSFSMEPVLAFLKAMLIVSDAVSGQSKGNSDLSAAGELSGCALEKASLSDFARYALRQVCSQDWVREICLKCPENLCNKDNLLEMILTQSQAQRVLQSICHPERSNCSSSSVTSDQRAAITNILMELDEWKLRISGLELHLMYEQQRSSGTDLNQWLDNVAQAAITVFCQSGLPAPDRPNQTVCNATGRHKLRPANLIAPLISKFPKTVQARILKVCNQVLNAVNFAAYTSYKLPTTPQPGAIPGGGSSLSGVGGSSSSLNGLGNAGGAPVLGLGGVGLGSGCVGNGGVSSGSSQIPVHNQRPFLHLMLMCLEAAQDDILSDLLESLRQQLTQPVSLFKELGRNRGEVEPMKRKQMLEALRLRFGLIGGLFDVITCHCSNLIITDWAILLVQLVVSGVIDLTNNTELFCTVLDMVAALIHSTLVNESASDPREENKRHYHNLVKKIKKEVGEYNNVSIRLLRQLILLPKLQVEVVVMEPWGSITDTKGNRHQDFDKDKKHGVQGAEKQKLSPWELLEGLRSPAPLSWTWLAATRLTRKTLKYHDIHQKLRFHTHTQQRPLSYFLEPLALPLEDLEPVPQKQVLQLPGLLKEEPKAPDTPSSDHSPRGGRGRGGGANSSGKNSGNRRRKIRAPPAVPALSQSTMPMNFQANSYGGGGGAGGLPQVSQWNSGYVTPPQQQQQQQQAMQQPYYQQLPPGGGGPPRYSIYPHNHSRSVIRAAILERTSCGGASAMGGGGLVASGTGPMGQQQPGSGFGSMGPMMTSHQGNPMIRRAMSRPQAGGMYPGGIQGPGIRHPIQGQPGQMYSTGPGGPTAGQGVSGGGLGQYGGYQQGQMMAGGNTGGLMGPGAYQQPGGYQSNMMGLRQPGYLSQGQMVQRPPQYMQTTAGSGNLALISGGQPYPRTSMGSMTAGAGPGVSMALGGTAGTVSMGAGAGGGSCVSMAGMGGTGGGGVSMTGMNGGASVSMAGMGGSVSVSMAGIGGSSVATMSSMGGAGGVSMLGGSGGGSAGGTTGGEGIMHHRMMLGTATTSTGGAQQQPQMMSHMQRTMSAPQQGQGSQGGPTMQGGQQQPTGQRPTMMSQGRSYPQPPF